MRRTLVPFLALILLAACGSGSGPSSRDDDARIQIRPNELIIGVGATVDLSANVTGLEDTALSWEATEGSIERKGFGARFTAPAESGTVHVTATSNAAPSVTAGATIEVLSDSEAKLQAPVRELPATQAREMRLVSTLAETRVDAGSDAEFVVPTGDQTTSTVAAMDVENGFGWTAVYPTWFGDSLTTTQAGSLTTQVSSTPLGPLSTAVQMLYMQPAIHYAEVEAAERIIGTLRELPEVAAFADALGAAASQSGHPLDDPAVTAAFEEAFEASLAALPDVTTSQAALRASNAPEGEVLTSLDTQWVLVVHNDGVLEPVWNITDSFGNDAFRNRALDWVGYLYQMDHTHFENRLDAIREWGNHPWLSDIPLASSEPVAALSLSADNFWTRFDLGFLYDYAVDSFVGRSEGARIPTEPGLYALHMYTWGLEDTPNNQIDRELISSWEGASANHRTAQAVNVLSFAMDAVTAALPSDLIDGLFQEEGFQMAIRTAITGQLVDYGDLSSISRADFNRLVADATATILNLASNAIKDGAIVAATEGKEALLKQFAKTVVKGADKSIDIIAAGGKIGYRYDHMTRASSLESWYLIVGDPWDSGDGIDEPDPPTDPAPYVSGVEPDPVPVSSTRQTIDVVGSDFQSGVDVTLYDPAGADFPIDDTRVTFVSSTRLEVYAGLTETGTWAVDVENPDGQQSNTAQFDVN